TATPFHSARTRGGRPARRRPRRAPAVRHREGRGRCCHGATTPRADRAPRSKSASPPIRLAPFPPPPWDPSYPSAAAGTIRGEGSGSSRAPVDTDGRRAPPMSTRGRKVLVVGATGRLGVAIAHALAARGDRPVLTARDPNKLEALSSEIGRAAG